MIFTIFSPQKPIGLYFQRSKPIGRMDEVEVFLSSLQARLPGVGNRCVILVGGDLYHYLLPSVAMSGSWVGREEWRHPCRNSPSETPEFEGFDRNSAARFLECRVVDRVDEHIFMFSWVSRYRWRFGNTNRSCFSLPRLFGYPVL